MQRLPIALLAPAAFILLACGSSPPPTHELTQAQGAVRAAEEIGTEDHPQAALYLKRAQDGIQRALVLIDDKRHDDARWELTKAEVDAELAIALAREATHRAVAKEALSRVERLREEMQ